MEGIGKFLLLNLRVPACYDQWDYSIHYKMIAVIRVVLKVTTGHHPIQARAPPIGDGRVTIMRYVQFNDHQFFSL
jgi:hypothetical protein